MDRTNGRASAAAFALITLFALWGAYTAWTAHGRLLRLDYMMWAVAEISPLTSVSVFAVMGAASAYVGWRAWTEPRRAWFPNIVFFVAMAPLWWMWATSDGTWWTALLGGLHVAAFVLLLLPAESAPPEPAPHPEVPAPHGPLQALTASQPWVLHVFWAVIGVGILLRVAAWAFMDIQWDGATYGAMAHSWVDNGGFIMPYGHLVWADTQPVPSHHYPPGYPIWLGLFYKLFGVGVWQTKLAAFAAGLLCLGVVYLVTRDLYGHAVALAATAVLSVEPDLILAQGRGFSENLGLAFFAVTMWSIVKSLDRPSFILIGGLSAGLAYLTRGSMGLFFIIAGLGGFLWRFYHRRWRVFTDVSYLAAAVLFLGFVAAWAGRNVRHFGWGGWETSTYVTYATDLAFSDLGAFAVALGYKWSFHFFLIAGYWVFLGPWLKGALRRAKEEHASAMWVAVFLLTMLAWIFASIFYILERHIMFWTDNRRYVAIAFLPLLWLALRGVDPTGKALRKRLFALIGVLFLVSLSVFNGAYQFPHADAGALLNERVEPGDVVAYDARFNKYGFYPYLPRTDILVVNIGWAPPPDYILTDDLEKEYPGFRLIGQWSVDPLWGRGLDAAVWARLDTT